MSGFRCMINSALSHRCDKRQMNCRSSAKQERTLDIGLNANNKHHEFRNLSSKVIEVFTTMPTSRVSNRSTVHYPDSAPSNRAPAATHSSILGGAVQTTIRAQAPTKMGVADRGQALVGPGRLGPTRPHEGMTAPMGDSRQYKEAFKTPGATRDRGIPIVDLAHCKNMKGRFEQLSDRQGVPDQSSHCNSYGCVKNTQFGAVRPQSAKGMPTFSTLCHKDLPPPPSSSKRQLDLGLEEREYRLDNFLARAGI